MSKASDVRETSPANFKHMSDLYGPFDLDVCATPQNAKCEEYYTKEQDGLKCLWYGKVWCNPPYSNIRPWVCKAWECGADTVCMVVPNTKGEQAWWQEAIEPYRDGRPSLVTGWNLTTHYQPKRWHFLQGGKPILDRNGRVGSARFGIVALVWRRA